MSKEAMKQALEKIATVNAMDYEYQAWAREALAKQEQGEPVALTDAVRAEPTELIHKWRVLELIKEHTTPQQRTWVGLDLNGLKDASMLDKTKSISELELGKAFWYGARWAEAELKEKNK